MMKKILVQALANPDHEGLPETAVRPGAVLDGKVVLIPAADNPNGGLVALRDGDEPIEVFHSTYIRRAILDGDLRVVEPKAAALPVKAPAKKFDPPVPASDK